MARHHAGVDAWLEQLVQWRAEMAALREVCLAGGLVETLKWGVPCYTHDGANVVLIHGFKGYCALAFFKGVLMRDPQHLLIRQTANVQETRQIRFTGLAQIETQRATLDAYVAEAIRVARSGARVALKTTAQFDVPEEFQRRLDDTPALKAAFDALTPGRQRAWLLHFAGAKQSSTRAARVDQASAAIMAGKGPRDR
ncbi:MAG: YdeI/OmpD-associated family protein [Duganella sp.]